MTEYPESEKLAEASSKSQIIGEFLEWIGDEKGWIFAESVEFDWEERYLPAHFATEKLLAEFFDIDLAKVETERQAMLAALRGAPQTP